MLTNNTINIIDNPNPCITRISLKLFIFNSELSNGFFTIVITESKNPIAGAGNSNWLVLGCSVGMSFAETANIHNNNIALIFFLP